MRVLNAVSKLRQVVSDGGWYILRYPYAYPAYIPRDIRVHPAYIPNQILTLSPHLVGRPVQHHGLLLAPRILLHARHTTQCTSV